jgi:hypothetical protein
LAGDEMVRLDAFALGHDAAATRGKRSAASTTPRSRSNVAFGTSLLAAARRREAMEKDDAVASR